MFSFKKQDKDKKDEFKIKLTPVKELSGMKSILTEEKVSLYKVGKLFHTYLASPSDPENSFLLCQAPTEAEGKNNFKLVNEKVKPLIELMGEDVCNVDQLQTLVDEVKNHKDYNDAHFAAILGSPALLEKPELKSLINEADPETGATPLHVAIKAGKVDNVKELLKLGAKNDAVDNNDRTIFHYAASCSNNKMFEVLSGSHASALVDKLNYIGETALHEACLTNHPENVEALLKLNFNPTVAGQDCNRYPIHCAIEANSLKSIELLCASSADQAKLKDKKNSSPLHLATSPEAIDILCDFEANLEDKDFQEEDTPLLRKVRENLFLEAARLLIRGANVKAVDKNNNSALALSVVGDKPEFVMLLLLFGADPNEVLVNDTVRHKAATTNLKNKDAIVYYLHHAGAGRCNKLKKDCSGYCSHKGSNNGKPLANLPVLKTAVLDEPLKAHLAAAESKALDSAKERRISVMEGHQPSSRKSSDSNDKDSTSGAVVSNGEPQSSPVTNQDPQSDIKLAGHRVLVIDGGGLEGLFIIRSLQALEELTQQPIKNCFDWIAGTGAGAYIALSLLQNKTLGEIFVRYWELLNKVLVGPRPYNAAHFEKLLMKQLGEKNKMFDLEGPKTIIFTTLMEKGNSNLHLFRNYELPVTDKSKKPNPAVPKPNEQLVWQAARSSGLGFGYFDVFGSFADGCLLAYNPTLDVLEEINEFNFASAKGDEIQPVHVVVSVGVKQQPQLFKDHPQQQQQPSKESNNLNNCTDKNEEILDLLFNQQLSLRVVEKSRAWCNDITVPYFRIQPPYPEPFTHTAIPSPTLDGPHDANCTQVDLKTIVTALWEADMFLKGKSSNLEQLSKLIL